jgi:hypothetical protein
MSGIRLLASLGLAIAVAYGVSAGLNWDQWQPFGWLVIIGGSGLWLTSPGGVARVDAVIAVVPSALFLLGFTVFRWQRPIWQLIDLVAIVCFLIVAFLSYTQRSQKTAPPKSKFSESTPSNAGDGELLLALRSLRADLAGDLPRYVVFTDKTLEELVKVKPTSYSQLVKVFGIGPSKAAKYGTKILNTIRAHVERSSLRRPD